MTRTSISGGAPGSTGSTGAAGASPGYQYAFSTTTTDADPGNGQMRGNNATFVNSTQIFIDDVDANSASMRDFWAGLGQNSNITFFQSASVFATFTVTAVSVLATGYSKLQVNKYTSAGTLANGVNTYVIAGVATPDWGARMRSQGHNTAPQTIAAGATATTLNSTVTDANVGGLTVTGTTPFTANRSYAAVNIGFYCEVNGLPADSSRDGEVWTGLILVAGVSKTSNADTGQAITVTQSVAQVNGTARGCQVGFRWRGGLNAGDTVQFQVKHANASAQDVINFYWTVEEDVPLPYGRCFDKYMLAMTQPTSGVAAPVTPGENIYKTLQGAFGNSVMQVMGASSNSGNGMDAIKRPTRFLFDMEWYRIATPSTMDYRIVAYNAQTSYGVNLPTLLPAGSIVLYESLSTTLGSGVVHTTHNFTDAEIDKLMQIPYRNQLNIFVQFRSSTSDGVTQAGIYKETYLTDYER